VDSDVFANSARFGRTAKAKNGKRDDHFAGRAARERHKELFHLHAFSDDAYFCQH
jgi:hypothetical protein